MMAIELTRQAVAAGFVGLIIDSNIGFAIGATPLIPRPAPATKSPFGAEGKGWCEQCQSLRSRQHASTCGARFCKLRPHI